MPAALGPRFALEAGFLILLAVVVGLADRGATVIVVVVAAGWLLVSLIEYFAWRQTLGVVSVRRYDSVEAPPPAPPPSEVVEDVPPPPPAVSEPAPVEEATIVQQASPAEEVESIEQADERVAGARASFAEAEQRTRHRLEPLQPRPRRRWFIFGGHVRRTKPAEGDRDEGR